MSRMQDSLLYIDNPKDLLEARQRNATESQRRSTCKAVYQNEQSLAASLVTATVDLFGLECINWAPETLKKEIKEETGVELGDKCLQRLVMGLIVLGSDMFFQDINVFLDVCNSFSGTMLDPQLFDPVDPEEAAWGIAEALLISPLDDEELEGCERLFDAEIRAYVGFILDDEGFRTTPRILSKLALRDKSMTVNRQNATFSHDPLMFQAEYKADLSQAEEVDNYVNSAYNTLREQIAAWGDEAVRRLDVQWRALQQKLYAEE